MFAPKGLDRVESGAVFQDRLEAKTHLNQADDYKYRSIDDLLDRLAPLLANTGCVSCRACLTVR